MTLAELIEQRDALRANIAKGVLKVVFRDREITYQTTSQMLAALRELDAAIAQTEGKPRVRFHEIRKDRGW